MRRGRWFTVLAVAGAIGVAGCGSSSSNSSTNVASVGTAGSGSAGAVAPSAIAAVAKYSQVPKVVPLGGELTAKPPAGKKIAVLACAIVSCEEQSRSLKEAGAHLGWTVTSYKFGQTPQTAESALHQAIVSHPSGVMIEAFPLAVFKEGLEQLKAANIPVVDLATANPNTPPIIGSVSTAMASATEAGPHLYGKLQADYIATASQGKANVLYMNTPDYPYEQAQTEATKTELAKVCSGCKLQVVNLALTELGPQTAGVIVSYLQKDPSINYLVLSFAEIYDFGVEAALANAGLANQVKIVTTGPVQSTFKAMKAGKITAVIASPNEMNSWYVMDMFARHFVGDPVTETSGKSPQIITDSDANPEWKEWPGVPEYQSQFLKAWKVN